VEQLAAVLHSAASMMADAQKLKVCGVCLKKVLEVE
jgi:hypothetical protein